MNPLDDQLNRLFRSAAAQGSSKVRPEAAPAPAFGLETRALAAWRSARSTEGSLWDMTLLVRGLIVASLIMAVSFWPALNSGGTAISTGTSSEVAANPYADFVQLADSTVSSEDEQ